MGAPAFTLEIDDSAELATVRPREGHLILVERLSPTEVVLRLTPAADSPAHAAPVTTNPDAAEKAAVTVSEAPTVKARDTEAQQDGQEEDVERATSNITAEQLSAAQSAVQRAIRGLTGPEAARVLDADGGHHGSGRGSTQISRQSSKDTPGGSPWVLSPDSTPSHSPRMPRGPPPDHPHRAAGGPGRASVATHSWNERLATGSRGDWAASSARRRSAGQLSRHSGGARSPTMLSGPAERDMLSTAAGADAGFRPRYGAPEWHPQQQQQRQQQHSSAAGQLPASHLPPTLVQRRHPPPPPPPPPPSGARQLGLPTAAFGSPSHMLSQVKRGIEGEAALQQAQARALRNGALAATRPVTHEAFEFWHDDGGGSGLESHGSREGAAVYADQQVDEAAQAVAQWSALRSSSASSAQQDGEQFSQQAQQRQQPSRSRLHEASLHVDDAARLEFGAQYEAQLAAQQIPWPLHQAQQMMQLQQGVQRQQGQRQRLQWWAEPNSQQTTSGGGGMVGATAEPRRLRQDSWPPPPQPTAGAQEAALAAMQHAAQQAAQLAASFGSSLALQGSAGPASDLMQQIEEREALQGGQQLPAMLGPAEWAPQPSTLNPALRQGTYPSTNSGAPADLRAATTAAWQDSNGMLRGFMRQASDPPTVAGASGGLGMPRFSTVRTRALSDDDGRHTRPASAGEMARPPSLRESVRTSSLQTPAATNAAAAPPPSFAVSLADQVFQASKAWSVSSADAELLARPGIAAASAASPQPNSTSSTPIDTADLASDMPVFPINPQMFDFLDGDQ